MISAAILNAINEGGKALTDQLLKAKAWFSVLAQAAAEFISLIIIIMIYGNLWDNVIMHINMIGLFPFHHQFSAIPIHDYLT